MPTTGEQCCSQNHVGFTHTAMLLVHPATLFTSRSQQGHFMWKHKCYLSIICACSPGTSGQCRQKQRKAGDKQQPDKCLFWHSIYDMVPIK